MALFGNKYRVETSRLSRYDYSCYGYYFITICTKDRHHFLGRIVDRKMALSDCGKIVDICWRAIPDHYKNTGLGVFAIMPDHFHGIIAIYGKNRPVPGIGIIAPGCENDGMVDCGNGGMVNCGTGGMVGCEDGGMVGCGNGGTVDCGNGGTVDCGNGGTVDCG
ncbi:MAG: transposase, partial [bacterium]